MSKHRIFIAITVPENVRRRLMKEVEPWRDLPIRWAAPANIHATLLFIGNVDEDELARIALMLPGAVEGVEIFDVTLHKIGIGPNARMPRMVWAEGETSQELVELQKRIQEVVVGDRTVYDDDGFQDSDVEDRGLKAKKGMSGDKSFRLHVTLGRMIPFKWQKLDPKPDIGKDAHISFPIRSVELMESDLGPEGPAYTILQSIPFD
ncbi:MAG: RNA 2',3'-cyclic phosphodiesterase [bacterium]|nr:RNA 2',3'-cyclic phosphodiesterase [bacterium]